MHESASENVALIYEFNQNSPLFARVAMDELENGNFEKAKEILDDGIKRYPNYPTPYFIYGITLAKLADYENALSAIKKGGEILGIPATEEFYLNKLEQIKNKNSLIEETRRVSFLEEEPAEEQNGPDDVMNYKPNNETNTDEEQTVEKQIPLEERLEDLAKELENAKIELPQEEEIVENTEDDNDDSDFISFESDDSFFEETDLVSETMAMILEGQGKNKEAIKIYEKLKKLEPEKAEIFDTKISELEKKISG